MSATLTAPAPTATPAAAAAAPPFPRPYLWSAAAFNDAGDRGAFAGRRAFLIDGVILEQGPMNPPHAMATSLADAAIRAAFGAGWYVRGQMPLLLGQHLDPQPDIAVVPGGPRDYPGHPTTAALVVEVADSSFTIDITTKAELYAAAGVLDYWVLDVDSRRLLVFRDPAPVAAGGHAYRTRLTLAPADAVSPLAAPTATVRVADLLP